MSECMFSKHFLTLMRKIILEYCVLMQTLHEQALDICA